ncbi:Methylglyoxal synthase [Candidatus Lokiarchaeum ossiferum]|uniref:Methylglyoxal synthase n=1 Tax=Candidatus Lokiarchaeum ossiferum TaxID=2951803 RepID=A0ABY6HZA0_9ARCH|nr:Methylglyoxal synthase [Candidatus Lokiarchaeum sp. B-35]
MNNTKKTIALVAHDKTKNNLLEWAKSKKECLEKYELIGTEHTAKLLYNVLELKVNGFGHGPDGGDILLAAKILEEKVNKVIFFIDARSPHGHEHDIQTLIRICVIKNVPIALNRATANLLLN